MVVISWLWKFASAMVTHFGHHLFFVKGVVKELPKQELCHKNCVTFYYDKILLHWWPGKVCYIFLQADLLQRKQNLKFLNFR